MEITYTKHGDYYFPDLTLPPQPIGDIGRFGRLRKKYLIEHQPDTFALMLMENTLTQHLIDIDRQAMEQIDLITSQIARAEGVTEDLKARDQLGWIQAMMPSMNCPTSSWKCTPQRLLFITKSA